MQVNYNYLRFRGLTHIVKISVFKYQLSAETQGKITEP